LRALSRSFLLISSAKAALGHFLGLANYEAYCSPRDALISWSAHATTPPFFPHYLFVRIERGWWNANWCSGIAALINGPQPAKLADAIIDGLKSRERDGLIALDEQPRFRAGDRVRVAAGSLAAPWVIGPPHVSQLGAPGASRCDAHGCTAMDVLGVDCLRSGGMSG
jgi:hypothetical protein